MFVTIVDMSALTLFPLNFQALMRDDQYFLLVDKLDVKTAKGQRIYEVISRANPSDKTGAYHNLGGVVVYGNRGWAPDSCFKDFASGAPTISHVEVFCDGAPMPDRICTLQFRPWRITDTGCMYTR